MRGAIGFSKSQGLQPAALEFFHMEAEQLKSLKPETGDVPGPYVNVISFHVQVPCRDVLLYFISHACFVPLQFSSICLVTPSITFTQSPTKPKVLHAPPH